MKLQCSVELPVKNLEMSDHFDYDFVIATTCITHPEYLEWYRKSKRMKILDNGAFETGKALANDSYIEFAKEISADLVVIPDEYKNAIGTLDRFEEFLDEWNNNLMVADLMGVIQAEGSLDMAHAMGVLYQSHGIKWIGVPYACGLDRYQLIKDHPEWKNVHILGLPTLPELQSLRLLPNVKSIDSSLPVKVTVEGKYIENCIRADSYAKPGDTSLNAELLSVNLRMFHDACAGLTCQT